MKIMIVTDNPNLHTGMAKVGGEIATSLSKYGHEVVYMGWNMYPEEQKEWPFKLIPVSTGAFGKEAFDSIVLQERPDVVLTIGDPWMYDYIGDRTVCKTRNLFKWVGYVAVDGEKIGGGLPDFWGSIIPKMDEVVAYTSYGKKALESSFTDLKDKVSIIYHGVNEKVFHPLPEETILKCKSQFNLQDKFLFLTVARNQGRKNWSELFKAWKIIQEENSCPGAMFWPHTYFYDNAGHNIDDLLITYGLDKTKSVIFFSQVARGNSATKLADIKQLNMLYNMADALVSVGGEGFGLPVIEAMGTKTPCVVLDHSATKELGADGRSIKIPATFYLTGRYLTERPISNPREIADAMIKMYKEETERKQIAEKGYSFAMNYTWEKIGKEWALYFDKLETPTEYPLVLKEVS